MCFKMYDLQIFIEDNWQYWARLEIEDEIVYEIASTPKELVSNIRKSLDSILKYKQLKNKSKFEKLLNYLDYHNASHI